VRVDEVEGVVAPPSPPPPPPPSLKAPSPACPAVGLLTIETLRLFDPTDGVGGRPDSVRPKDARGKCGAAQGRGERYGTSVGYAAEAGAEADGGVYVSGVGSGYYQLISPSHCLFLSLSPLVFRVSFFSSTDSCETCVFAGDNPSLKSDGQ